MMIHEEQQNVAAFLEHAEFVDSGFQSFREQVTHMKPAKFAEAAFFAGAALSFKLMEHFEQSVEKHGDGSAEFLEALLMAEIADYLERNGLRLEWEPHVPQRWQQ